MRLFGTMKNNDGMLTIGGVSVAALKAKYGTPLYVMDTALIEENIAKYKNNFVSDKFDTGIIYACKAFFAHAMCQIADKYGLELDAVSGGELYGIKTSGFPMGRVHMHGNNKTPEELRMCVNYGIGLVIVDNITEIKKLQQIAAEAGKKVKIMLRLNVGIDAHTHEYINTSKNISKFGESIYDDKIDKFVEKAVSAKNLELVGIHSHIGSQIFDTKAFSEEISLLLDFVAKIADKYGVAIEEVNLGGGPGVYYTSGDVAVDVGDMARLLIENVEAELDKRQMKIKKLSIEPGRSIVANAGSSLYTVGGVKQTFGGVKYVFVDGGMSDNIRPALYQAKYEAVIANKMDAPLDTKVHIAGKFCESGDVLVKDVDVASPEIDDLLVIPTTGAYGYSMASNYNMAPIPAVVFVKDGVAQLAVRRQSYDDMLATNLKIDV